MHIRLQTRQGKNAVKPTKLQSLGVEYSEQ